MIMRLASTGSASTSINSSVITPGRHWAFGFKIEYTRHGLTIHAVSKTEQIHWHLDENLRKKEPEKFLLNKGIKCSPSFPPMFHQCFLYIIFPHHSLYSLRTLSMDLHRFTHNLFSPVKPQILPPPIFSPGPLLGAWPFRWRGAPAPALIQGVACSHLTPEAFTASSNRINFISY